MPEDERTGVLRMRIMDWKKWVAAAVAVLALGGLVWTFTWKSDKEKLSDLLDYTVASLEDGDVEAAMEGVSPEFQSQGIDRDQLARLLRAGLDRYGRPNLLAFKKEFRVGKGVASCRFILLAWDQGSGRQPVRTRWTVSFVKKDEDWYISGVKPTGLSQEYWRMAKSLAGREGLDLDLGQ